MTGNLDALIDSTFIISGPDDYIEQLARYSELGFPKVSLCLFYPGMSQRDLLNHIELVARDVLPEVHHL